MNWRIFVGVALIWGAVSEMYSIWKDYSTGKLTFWPVGADIASVIMVGVGFYLIKKGMNKNNNISNKLK